MRAKRADPGWPLLVRLLPRPEPSRHEPYALNMSPEELEEYAMLTMEPEQWSEFQGRLWMEAFGRGELVSTGVPGIDDFLRRQRRA